MSSSETENEVMPSPEQTQATQEEQQPLVGQALREAVLKQIEYYFSRHNLSKDAFLVSQMDHDMYVPIDVVAQFKLVQTLTTDVDFILDVMKESQNVQVDAEQRKIKPNMTVTRNTVILREIPSDADEEVIQKLFHGEGCPKPTNIRSEVGDNWFVTFDTESDALDALFYLRKQEFNGKPIKAGMKSENLLRSSYPNGEQAHNFQPFFPSAAPPRWKFGWDMQGYEPFNKRGHGRFRGRGRGSRKDDRKPRDFSQGNIHKDKTKGGKKKRRDRGDKRPVPPNSSEFPPLPSSRMGKDSTQTGYEEAFIKYSKQEIIDTLSAITECKRPDGLPKDCLAVAETANCELELTKPLLQSDGESMAAVVDTNITNSAHKSFAEAVLTAQDIKTPEGRKRSAKNRRSSVKEAVRKEGKRKDRHNDKESHEEQKKKQKPKKSKSKPHAGHKKKQHKPKKDNQEKFDENQATGSADESSTSYAAVLKKKEQEAAAAAAAAQTVASEEAAVDASPAEDAN